MVFNFQDSLLFFQRIIKVFIKSNSLDTAFVYNSFRSAFINTIEKSDNNFVVTFMPSKNIHYLHHSTHTLEQRCIGLRLAWNWKLIVCSSSLRHVLMFSTTSVKFEDETK